MLEHLGVVEDTVRWFHPLVRGLLVRTPPDVVGVRCQMFMFGGYGGSGRLDDFWEFDFGEALVPARVSLGFTEAWSRGASYPRVVETEMSRTRGGRGGGGRGEQCFHHTASLDCGVGMILRDVGMHFANGR